MLYWDGEDEERIENVSLQELLCYSGLKNYYC